MGFFLGFFSIKIMLASTIREKDGIFAFEPGVLRLEGVVSKTPPMGRLFLGTFPSDPIFVDDPKL